MVHRCGDLVSVLQQCSVAAKGCQETSPSRLVHPPTRATERITVAVPVATRVRCSTVDGPQWKGVRVMAIIGVILLGLVVSAAGSLAFGWVFMLLIGVVHAEWLPALPTIGYWWAVLITFLLRATLMSVDTDLD